MIQITPEAKAKYMTRRRENLVRLRASLEKHETEDFKMIGHQLKGNARTFGFPDLETIAIELEKVGTSENWVRAKELVDEFQRWIDTNQ